jgi:hypothetical protein
MTCLIAYLRTRVVTRVVTPLFTRLATLPMTRFAAPAQIGLGQDFFFSAIR